MKQGIIREIKQNRKDEIKKINAVDLTGQLKNKFADVFNKVQMFLDEHNLSFDILNLRIYVDYSDYLGMEAEQFDDVIILKKGFFDKDNDGKSFSLIHELVHYVARKNAVQVDNKVHERSGYGLQHLNNKLETENSFFKEFNEGVTEWITALITGNANEIISYKKQYKLVVYLVNKVSNAISKDDIIYDYFNNGTKFLHVIKDEYGSGSMKILNMMDASNVEQVLEFFMTNNEERRKVLKNALLSNE